MSISTFKVIFKGTKETDQDNLNLIFKNLISEKISFPANIILELKEISKVNKNVISFQNISEVLEVGKELTSLFNYYYIVLLTHKKGNKRGFLIANERKKGDILIGTWPFDDELSNREIIEIINGLIKNIDYYIDICIIN
ncbi:MAG: hypothetical protein EU532_14880 [Promethearchaeota archaeon]|nr:MAG: hypothetical protein EU532_14880 [Candidatus Lokiarchaeota archaeon]